jgi:hypothetical protein
MQYRFAVGAKDGPASSSWKLIARPTGDVYLSVRGGAPAKLSFHQSGRCRWALNSPLPGDRDRAMLKWERDPVPDEMQFGSRLVQLAFPTNHLSAKFGNNLEKVEWISPAPLDRALGLDLYLTRADEDLFRDDVEKLGGKLQYFAQMAKGYSVALFSRDFECGKVELSMPRNPSGSGYVFGDLYFPDQDSANTGRPIRMLVSRGSDLQPTLYELGGYDPLKMPV